MRTIENKLLSKETLYSMYYIRQLSPNAIARAFNEQEIKVSSETIRMRLIQYGYKLRERSDAVTIALGKKHQEKYGSAN